MLVAVLAFASCAPIPKPGADVPVISLKSGEILNPQNIDKEAMNFEEVVIEVDEGDRLPMEFAMHGDVFEGVSKQPLMLRATQACRIYINEKRGLFLSWDGESYRPMYKALKGSVSLGAKTNSGKPASGIVQATLERRKEN